MSRDFETLYYEQQANHTEARGMLAQERDTWKRRYEEEYAIVARVWKALGVDSYESAGGKAIDELVAEKVAACARVVGAVWGAPCAACHKPVWFPTARGAKAAFVMGDRIWHGDCAPEAMEGCSTVAVASPSEERCPGFVPGADPRYCLQCGIKVEVHSPGDAPGERSQESLRAVLVGLRAHLAAYRRTVYNPRSAGDVEVCSACGQREGHSTLCVIGIALEGIDNALAPDTPSGDPRP